MNVERGGVDAGLLLGGESVEFSSYTIYAVEDMESLAMLGALEERVLNEMSHTFVVTFLITRTDVDIDSRVGHGGVVLTEDNAYAVA